MAANIFNTIRLEKPNSNVFDLSHDVKLSLNMGELIPVSVIECVPGDRIQMSTESLLRMAPMVAPVMHKVDVYTHSFFVPNRIIWANWEKFITGGQDGTDPGPAAPYVGGFVPGAGSLSDYLGLPIGETIDKVSALPFAAYELIYHEYYRDQNLQPMVRPILGDGDNTGTPWLGQLRKRAWQHDYFTSSLPFAQKGASVDIPISSGDLPIKVNTFGTAFTSDTDALIGASFQPSGSPSTVGVEAEDRGSGGIPSGYLYADGSNATGASGTINDLRRAFRLQEWLERNARAGSRYVESILSHFGVKSSDARLQRPEYLGGSKQPMIISEVLQTSSTDTETPQGNMAGHGVSVGSGRDYSYFCEEHGYVLTILSVVPKTAYQQGIPRHFSKFDKLQYFWPSFAHLGEQEVLNREIFYDGGDPDNDEVFGYVPRYSEYRYLDSRVAGDFRTNLSYWHLGRIFSSRPALNSSFITCDPTHRIFAVEDPSEDKIYAHVFHRIKAVRRMPKWGTPSF